MDSPIQFPPSSPPRLAGSGYASPVHGARKTNSGLLPGFVPSSPGGTTPEDDHKWSAKLKESLQKAIQNPRSFSSNREDLNVNDDNELPLSSPPGMPSHVLQEHKSSKYVVSRIERAARYPNESIQLYPTPAPTSSAGFRSSSPPVCAYHDSQDEEEEEQMFHHDDASEEISMKRPLENPELGKSHASFARSSNLRASCASSAVFNPIVIRVPRSGREVSVGRSSQSCDYALSSKNKLVSRVHVCISYVPASNRIVFACLGWNGCRITVPEYINIESVDLENQGLNGKGKLITKDTISNEQTDYILPKGQQIDVEYVEGITIDVRGERAGIEVIDDEKKTKKVTLPAQVTERAPLEPLFQDHSAGNVDQVPFRSAEFTVDSVEESKTPAKPVVAEYTVSVTKPVVTEPTVSITKPVETKLSTKPAPVKDQKLASTLTPPVKLTQSHTPKQATSTPTLREAKVKAPLTSSIHKESHLPSHSTPVNSRSETKKQSSHGGQQKQPTPLKRSTSTFPFFNLNKDGKGPIALGKKPTIEVVKVHQPLQQQELVLKKRPSGVALLDAKEPKQKRVFTGSSTVAVPPTHRVKPAVKQHTSHGSPRAHTSITKPETPVSEPTVVPIISEPQVSEPISTSTTDAVEPSSTPALTTKQLDQDLTTLDIPNISNLICNHLAFSRLSSTPLSTLFSSLSTSSSTTLPAIDNADGSDQQPALTLDLLRHLLKDSKTIPCVGIIYRQGKDAAGKPLEEEYYYVAEKDTDLERKGVVEQLRGRGGGLRACRKTHKQYFWKKPGK